MTDLRFEQSHGQERRPACTRLQVAATAHDRLCLRAAQTPVAAISAAPTASQMAAPTNALVPVPVNADAANPITRRATTAQARKPWCDRICG